MWAISYHINCMPIIHYSSTVKEICFQLAFIEVDPQKTLELNFISTSKILITIIGGIRLISSHSTHHVYTLQYSHNPLQVIADVQTIYSYKTIVISRWHVCNNMTQVRRRWQWPFMFNRTWKSWLFWCWNLTIPGYLGQWHGWWFLGSSVARSSTTIYLTV